MIKKIKKKVKRSLGPKVLRRMDICGEEKPIISEALESKLWKIEGENADEIFTLVDEIKESIFSDFRKNDKVLIKINLNTALSYPASTDVSVLDRLVDILIALGIEGITIGDCSSNGALPTRNVFKEKGIFDIIGNKASYVCFDEGEWVKVKIDGFYLDDVVLPKTLYEVDKIIYLANLKSHRLADFSMSMKLAVGLMHPLQRIPLHQSNLQEKVAEICLAVQPDLIFLDALEPFITGGPNEGTTARGNHLLIGNKLVDIDLKGYELLYCLRKENNCQEQFEEDPLQMRQFKHYYKIFNR